MESKPDAALTSSEEEKVAVAAAVAESHEEEATPVVLKKGPWTTAEDAMLMKHVRQHGEGNWNAVQRMTGLLRCGKSCRLRWTNHLRPNLKKGSFSPDEELLIAQLHAQLGNKWARMASHLPGRTDNEIKNYWNTRTKRRQRAGLPVYPPEVQLQLALSKRCRYDDISPLSSPQQSGSNVLSLDAVDATSAGYTSARPPPLDLAGQLAMANQPVQFLTPTPFSAPSSPWAKPFSRNAQYFQFPHSSPVSPTTPTGPVHPVTPELSLGYGLHVGDRTRFLPLSPSPGARVELPSSQLRPAMPLSSAAASATGGGGLGGEALQDHQNTASLEAMLQELHDAIKVEPPAPANVEAEGGGGGRGDQHGVSGNNNKSEGELKDDMDTLFDLMIPATFPTPEPAAPAAAPIHSGSISQHSSDDQDHSNVDLGMDLPVIGGAGSSEQDWSQLDGACQWINMSGIC